MLRCRIIEVLDKGKAASVTTQVITKDKNTGTVIFENQSTVFIRGSGGFGGQRVGKGTSTRTRNCVLESSQDSPNISLSPWALPWQRKTDRGPATAANNVPKRKPDVVVEEKTTSAQAALYRLNGDLNPLHVRSSFIPQARHG